MITMYVGPNAVGYPDGSVSIEYIKYIEFSGKPSFGTGVQYTPGREQPYTVWVKNEVVLFCSTRKEAFTILNKEISDAQNDD